MYRQVVSISPNDRYLIIEKSTYKFELHDLYLNFVDKDSLIYTFDYDIISCEFNSSSSLLLIKAFFDWDLYRDLADYYLFDVVKREIILDRPDSRPILAPKGYFWFNKNRYEYYEYNKLKFSISNDIDIYIHDDYFIILKDSELIKRDYENRTLTSFRFCDPIYNINTIIGDDIICTNHLNDFKFNFDKATLIPFPMEYYKRGGNCTITRNSLSNSYRTIEFHGAYKFLGKYIFNQNSFINLETLERSDEHPYFEITLSKYPDIKIKPNYYDHLYERTELIRVRDCLEFPEGSLLEIIFNSFLIEQFDYGKHYFGF